MRALPARPRAVLYDWDNTLVNTLPLIHAAHNHVRQAYGLEVFDTAQAKANLRHSTRTLYPEIYGSKWREAEELLYSYVASHHLEKLEVCAPAAEILGHLHQKQIPQGVVSNKKGTYLRAEIAHLNWQHCFGESVVGAGDAEYDKPHHAPVRKAMQSLIGTPAAAEIWMVGDRDVDMIMARNAGLCGIFIKADDAPYNGPEPDYSCDSLEDFFDLLRIMF